MNTPYTTPALFQATFGEIEATSIIDSGTDLLQLCENANALVDSYVPLQYAKPLVEIPSVLTVVANDIARFYAYKDSAPEVVVKRYDDAVAFLSRVFSGSFALPEANITPTPPPPPDAPVDTMGEGFGAGFVSAPKLFTSKTTKWF